VAITSLDDIRPNVALAADNKRSTPTERTNKVLRRDNQRAMKEIHCVRCGKIFTQRTTRPTSGIWVRSTESTKQKSPLLQKYINGMLVIPSEAKRPSSVRWCQPNPALPVKIVQPNTADLIELICRLLSMPASQNIHVFVHVFDHVWYSFHSRITSSRIKFDTTPKPKTNSLAKQATTEQPTPSTSPIAPSTYSTSQAAAEAKHWTWTITTKAPTGTISISKDGI